MTPEEIGKRLRSLRGDRMVAEVAEATGLGVSAISNYENGIRIPRDSAKIALARYYGVSIDDLFFAGESTDSGDAAADP